MHTKKHKTSTTLQITCVQHFKKSRAFKNVKGGNQKSFKLLHSSKTVHKKGLIKNLYLDFHFP